jgi:hypothetical protein
MYFWRLRTFQRAAASWLKCDAAEFWGCAQFIPYICQHNDALSGTKAPSFCYLRSEVGRGIDVQCKLCLEGECNRVLSFLPKEVWMC